LTSAQPIRTNPLHAQVAELVDALASGASGLTAVKVRVLSWAPLALFADVRHPSKVAENTEDQETFLSTLVHCGLLVSS
jgi:hypothetical protein